MPSCDPPLEIPYPRMEEVHKKSHSFELDPRGFKTVIHAQNHGAQVFIPQMQFTADEEGTYPNDQTISKRKDNRTSDGFFEGGVDQFVLSHSQKELSTTEMDPGSQISRKFPGEEDLQNGNRGVHPGHDQPWRPHDQHRCGRCFLSSLNSSSVTKILPVPSSQSQVAVQSFTYGPDEFAMGTIPDHGRIREEDESERNQDIVLCAQDDESAGNYSKPNDKGRFVWDHREYIQCETTRILKW